MLIPHRYSSLEHSRKWGVYAITNLLFKTYFTLKTTNLCGNVLKAIGACNVPDIDAFPMADRVTFAYYQGILAFVDESYSDVIILPVYNPQLTIIGRVSPCICL